MKTLASDAGGKADSEARVKAWEGTYQLVGRFVKLGELVNLETAKKLCGHWNRGASSIEAVSDRAPIHVVSSPSNTIHR